MLFCGDQLIVLVLLNGIPILVLGIILTQILELGAVIRGSTIYKQTNRCP